ncbi:MAG: bifunctional riboflavin kinase/FAD synthetase [Burkholderiaceae bacterium]|jgi:riboflavin kinase/FMN adenylyltransferase|nr:bifunctional riboflavin kinase/FAD synthetase [Burkholderiaceae bacterium]
MLIFQGISPRRAPKCGRAVTIGNFDGVHLGHRALIQRTVAVARDRQLTSAVVTFEPHPKAFFTPQQAPGKIQGLRAKAALLADLGVDELWVCRFRRSLAQMSAEDFMTRFLHQSMGTAELVIGDDFRFGAKRRGDVEMLRQYGASADWIVQTIPTVLAGGERVSSSRLRVALAAGDLQGAEEIMGHPLFLCGHVVHGRKLGRDLGYPTLNIPVSNSLLISGVFVVSVEGLGAAPIAAVASLGHRPTVEQAGRLLLEVHLFDWQGDAYGKIVKVTFHEKLRDEARFDSLEAMTEQIHLDAQQARLYFAHHAH